jgi:hypothetical protein
VTRGASLGLAVALALAAVGCGDGVRATIALEVPPELVSTFDEFVAFIPARGLTVDATGEPAPAAQYRIVVATDLGGCSECYRVDGAADGRGWVVHASDRLGAQYGVAEVFELLGYRFRHPFDTYVPARPAPDPAAVARLGVVHAPEMRVRGLHLHTLHPTEAMFALWVPTDDGAKARRIFDWILKNRGTTCSGSRSTTSSSRPERGVAAHRAARGAPRLKASSGWLFGASSLRNGYGLIDEAPGRATSRSPSGCRGWSTACRSTATSCRSASSSAPTRRRSWPPSTTPTRSCTRWRPRPRSRR